MAAEKTVLGGRFYVVSTHRRLPERQRYGKFTYNTPNSGGCGILESDITAGWAPFPK